MRDRPYLSGGIRNTEMTHQRAKEGINQRPNTTESRSLGKQRKREREREREREQSFSPLSSTLESHLKRNFSLIRSCFSILEYNPYRVVVTHLYVENSAIISIDV